MKGIILHDWFYKEVPVGILDAIDQHEPEKLIQAVKCTSTTTSITPKYKILRQVVLHTNISNNGE